MIEAIVGLFVFFFLCFLEKILGLKNKDENIVPFIFGEHENNFDDQENNDQDF